MTRSSLSSTILQYRIAYETYNATLDQMEACGDRTDLPKAYEPFMNALEGWDRPAESLDEAVMALQLADEDYVMGDTPRIPAMIKAALGWLEAEKQRSAPPVTSKYIVDDVHSSAGHLNDLLEVMGELQFGLYAGETDKRVDSLLWVARDISNGIIDHLDGRPARRSQGGNHAE